MNVDGFKKTAQNAAIYESILQPNGLNSDLGILPTLLALNPNHAKSGNNLLSALLFLKTSQEAKNNILPLWALNYKYTDPYSFLLLNKGSDHNIWTHYLMSSGKIKDRYFPLLMSQYFSSSNRQEFAPTKPIETPDSNTSTDTSTPPTTPTDTSAPPITPTVPGRSWYNLG